MCTGFVVQFYFLIPYWIFVLSFFKKSHQRLLNFIKSLNFCFLFVWFLYICSSSLISASLFHFFYCLVLIFGPFITSLEVVACWLIFSLLFLLYGFKAVNFLLKFFKAKLYKIWLYILKLFQSKYFSNSVVMIYFLFDLELVRICAKFPNTWEFSGCFSFIPF